MTKDEFVAQAAREAGWKPEYMLRFWVVRRCYCRRHLPHAFNCDGWVMEPIESTRDV
jgi:hypothetical protein